ncbi:TetR/AcrR family transcriptional regulator [Shewanella dokdonensis]|uniref:TetR/AcrR family transcriptional regulator n=1 Tax=Shewanella dokdonensis TaxID=712036 RepID=A0ABX8DCM0_9GAMM|nr:TetR/AcrR family transcriptional regulator [Shewanella dokdonensis]QVK22466.1 TetR/AcrR family transcriptional regulator [Shewanella dokdonensis]
MKNTHQPEKSVAAGAVRGRPRLFDREAALDQAMRLFWRKGFSATSLSDLTSSMGISPPSLYAAFGSKETLYAEALAHYRQSFGNKLWAGFDEAATAREAITAYLMNAVRLFGGAAAADYPAGCMLALSAVGEEGNAILGKIVRDARAQTLQHLDERLARAVSEGELPAAKATGLARFILAVQGDITTGARWSQS